MGTESPDASGGGGDESTGEKAKITHEPVASFTRTDNFEEICTLLTFVISATLGFLSRISVRYAALPVLKL